MTGTRILVAVLLTAGVAAPAVARDDAPAASRKRPDPSRVRFLAEMLRSDPDEKKRKAAVNELADADPRTHPEVMPALIAALKKDAAAVRATAAEVIGKFKTTFPVAGAALESLAESDPDPNVRVAAKQALWDYHLNGYRSPKTGDLGVGQTAEPPMASPPTRVSPASVSSRVSTSPNRSVLTPRLPEITPSLPPKRAVAPAAFVGPRAEVFEGVNTPRRLLSLPLRPIYTHEPPLAKRPVWWIPPPPMLVEPPIFIQHPEPGAVTTPAVMPFELPSIVPHPGPQPGVPSDEPTHEPPVRKVAQK